MSRIALFAVLELVLLGPSVTWADDAARPGEVVAELPTLKCLGVRWPIFGDANHNARVAVAYRRAGTRAWQPALDLFRVETAALHRSDELPPGATLYAGSVFGLDEDSAYEVRLSLHDPDGGDAERIVPMKTWAEPQLPRGGQTIDIGPDTLPDAVRRARPGDVLALRPGVYRGPIALKSGEPGKPIALVGSGQGAAILDGQGGNAVVGQSGLHDLMFENLTVRNATYGIVINEGARLTVRRCQILDVDYGFTATRNGARQQRFFIADNVITGRSTWPRSRGIEDRRGVQVGGTGHVVCYNRISRFGDGIDTFPAYPTTAIDFYGNEISECTDDGVELDYSQHNTRCFDNRLTNVFQGISVQPVHGGPVYIFRNAMYNVVQETFKMHDSPSGALMLHNTSVKAGMPLVLSTSEPVSNCVYRNNLFLGTTANYAYEASPPMRACDFDYDGFGGQWKLFLKFNGVRYASIDEARQKAPVYHHAVRVDPATAFRAGRLPPRDAAQQFPVTENDLRLAAGTAAIDAGVPLPNVDDSFRGRTPDLGAYEFGCPLPHYGPRDRDK